MRLSQQGMHVINPSLRLFIEEKTKSLCLEDDHKVQAKTTKTR